MGSRLGNWEMPIVLSNLIGTRAKRNEPRCTRAVQNFNISIYSQVTTKVGAHRLQINSLWNDLKLIVTESLFSEKEEDVEV